MIGLGRGWRGLRRLMDEKEKVNEFQCTVI